MTGDLQRRFLFPHARQRFQPRTARIGVQQVQDICFRQKVTRGQIIEQYFEPAQRRFIAFGIIPPQAGGEASHELIGLHLVKVGLAEPCLKFLPGPGLGRFGQAGLDNLRGRALFQFKGLFGQGNRGLLITPRLN
jgi:hypothetical protein